jgi:Arc/MetJ family transcription regulator
MEALMDKIPVEVDAAVLAEAAEELGTETHEETVSTAIREAVARARRLKALDELSATAQTGAFDELLDKNNYRR